MPQNGSEGEVRPEDVPETKTDADTGTDTGCDRLISKPLVIGFAVLGISILIYILSRFFPGFAEFWSRYPAQAVRFVLAKLTDFLPFSLAESVIIILPLLLFLYIFATFFTTRKDKGNAGINRWARPMIAATQVICILFCIGFGSAYGRYPLAKNIGAEQNAVSETELAETAEKIANELYFDLEEITFDTSGASVMPYSYNGLVKLMNASFEKYASQADYISHYDSHPKPIALSRPMTYTHISGVYTFMTGESNINTNYPDFLLPFTMAHEMAHQRGIAREDEANFVAFLVCIGSDDTYIRYSGYANMLHYMYGALQSAERELLTEFVRDTLPAEVRKEFNSYSEFFDKYRESKASTVTETINDTTLKLHGQKNGTKSYGLVVDLAVAYYKGR